MTVQFRQDETAAFDRTSSATFAPTTAVTPRGVRIDVEDLSRRVPVRKRRDLTLLDAVSFTLSAGELVAVVGPAALARRRCWRPSPATLRRPGGRCVSTASTCTPTSGHSVACSATCHRTTSSTPTRYAARLRLPSSLAAGEVDGAVRDALDAVDLIDQADGSAC